MGCGDRGIVWKRRSALYYALFLYSSCYGTLFSFTRVGSPIASHGATFASTFFITVVPEKDDEDPKVAEDCNFQAVLPRHSRWKERGTSHDMVALISRSNISPNMDTERLPEHF
jgi:hypothetical protein